MEVASPPASAPPACAAPVPLRAYFSRMGLELIGLEGVDAEIDNLEVYGFAPGGADGKPDMSRAVLLEAK